MKRYRTPIKTRVRSIVRDLVVYDPMFAQKSDVKERKEFFTEFWKQRGHYITISLVYMYSDLDLDTVENKDLVDMCLDLLYRNKESWFNKEV